MLPLLLVFFCLLGVSSADGTQQIYNITVSAPLAGISGLTTASAAKVLCPALLQTVTWALNLKAQPTQFVINDPSLGGCSAISALPTAKSPSRIVYKVLVMADPTQWRQVYSTLATLSLVSKARLTCGSNVTFQTSQGASAGASLQASILGPNACFSSVTALSSAPPFPSKVKPPPTRPVRIVDSPRPPPPPSRLSVSPPATPENLLRDGGFEKPCLTTPGSSGGWDLDNLFVGTQCAWYYDSGNASTSAMVQIDSKNNAPVHSGDQVLSLWLKYEGVNGMNQRIPTAIGAKYHFSVWALGNAMRYVSGKYLNLNSSQVRNTLMVYAGDVLILNTKVLPDYLVSSADRGWYLLSTNFTAASTETTIRILGNEPDAGGIYFDDASVVLLAAGPSFPRPPIAPPFPAPSPPTGPNILLDGGFEAPCIACQQPCIEQDVFDFSRAGCAWLYDQGSKDCVGWWVFIQSNAWAKEHGTSNYRHSGDQGLVLCYHGSQYQGMNQTVETTIGAVYRFSVWALDMAPPETPTPNLLLVFAGDKIIINTTVQRNSSWIPYMAEFTSIDSQTTIRILGNEPGPGAIMVDDASLVALTSTSSSKIMRPPPPPPPPLTPRQKQVCDRWTADTLDKRESAWSGNSTACNAGTMTLDAQYRALKITNLYRWLVGLNDVTLNSGWTEGAQQCALMMFANEELSHSPPTNWSCYTSAGASTAGQSNLAYLAGAVAAIHGYMTDYQVVESLGHRRWIISSEISQVAFGSVGEGQTIASCMRVMGSDATPQAIKWVAFPPPGPVPFGSEIHFGELDNAGWSVQSDEIDLTGAQVTVTSQGANLPVTVSTLPPGYGSNSAISFRPQGWASRPGIDYEVKVTCSSGQVISYTVSPVKC